MRRVLLRPQRVHRKFGLRAASSRSRARRRCSASHRRSCVRLTTASRSADRRVAVGEVRRRERARTSPPSSRRARARGGVARRMLGRDRVGERLDRVAAAADAGGAADDEERRVGTDLSRNLDEVRRRGCPASHRRFSPRSTAAASLLPPPRPGRDRHVLLERDAHAPLDADALAQARRRRGTRGSSPAALSASIPASPVDLQRDVVRRR